MSEIERFLVRSSDGREWTISKRQKTTTYSPLASGTATLKAGYELVVLEGAQRYHANETGADSYSIVDFGSDAPDTPVMRIR